MKRDEFYSSMRQILAFFKLPKTSEETEHQSNYLNALFASVSWMKNFEFDQVCKSVGIDIGPTSKRPTPNQFLIRYETLGNERGWKAKKQMPSSQLSQADHLKWCLGSVNGGIVVFDNGSIQDFGIGINSSTAKEILGMVNHNLTTFPQPVMDALLERSTLEDDEVPTNVQDSVFFKVLEKVMSK